MDMTIYCLYVTIHYQCSILTFYTTSLHFISIARYSLPCTYIWCKVLSIALSEP
jgi:hypothetical protein